jgi:hypothetical protein
LVEGLARVLVYSYFLGFVLMLLGIPFFLVSYCNAASSCSLPDSVYNFFILLYGVGVTWLPVAGIQGVIPWFYITTFLPSGASWQLVGLAILVPSLVVQFIVMRKLNTASKTDEVRPLQLAGYHHLVFTVIGAAFVYYTVGPLLSIIAIFLNLAGFQGFRSAVNVIKEKEELNRPRSAATGATRAPGKTTSVTFNTAGAVTRQVGKD